MLRELHELLGELHDGINAVALRGGARVSKVEMTLPLELRPVFRDGGCVLLADVPRGRSAGTWVASPSKLVVGWTDGELLHADTAARERAHPTPASNQPVFAP